MLLKLKNYIFILILFYISETAFISCTDHKGKNHTPGITIEMESSDPGMPADDNYTIKFAYIVYNTRNEIIDVPEEEISFYNGPIRLNGGTFKTPIPGIYTFTAEYDNHVSNEITVEAYDEKGFIYYCMKEYYLWYDEVPDLDYTAYTSLDDLLYDLMYLDLDKWSFIVPSSTADAYYGEGMTEGFGIGFIYEPDASNDYYMRIRYVFNESPAGMAELERSDKILEADGYPVNEFIDNSTLMNNIFSNYTVDFRIDRNGMVFNMDLTRWVYKINSVLYNDIIITTEKKIGYLVYNRFLSTSIEELEAVFSLFKSENIDDLIIDLRYNTGGSLDVTQYLASLITGDNTDGKIMARIQFNDKYSHINYSVYFEKEDISLNMNRVFFITDNNSASASELLINTLSPYIEVKIIGNRTHGKPAGMVPIDFFDMTLYAINFKIVNANDYGDYFDGIAPDATSDDGTEYSWGDINENCLAEALFYIEHGYFSSTQSRAGSNVNAESKVSVEPIFRGFKKITGVY